MTPRMVRTSASTTTSFMTLRMVDATSSPRSTTGPSRTAPRTTIIMLMITTSTPTDPRPCYIHFNPCTSFINIHSYSRSLQEPILHHSVATVAGGRPWNCVFLRPRAHGPRRHGVCQRRSGSIALPSTSMLLSYCRQSHLPYIYRRSSRWFDASFEVGSCRPECEPRERRLQSRWDRPGP
jgi:hypothetical protein